MPVQIKVLVMTIFRVNDKAVEICNDTLTNTFCKLQNLFDSLINRCH